MTADEARALIEKSRQTNVIRSSVPGDPAIASLPEIQCSKGGVESPEHYRELVSIIEHEHIEKWNKLASDHIELRRKHAKLEGDHARAVVELRQERIENEKLRKRLSKATEMVDNPPEGPAGGITLGHVQETLGKVQS